MQPENPDRGNAAERPPVNPSAVPDQQSLDARGEPAEPPSADVAEAEPRPSRGAAWIAMGAVTLALALIWLAPGIGDSDHDLESRWTLEHPDDAEDTDARGKPAPLHFTLKDMHGVDVQLASFEGRVILLNFWATWCLPCKVEIPWLVELQEAYADDLVVLGFSVDDPPEKLTPFAAEYKINYPILVGDGREDVQDAFGPMYGIPVTVIIGRDGRIAQKHTGIRSKEQLEQEIKELL